MPWIRLHNPVAETTSTVGPESGIKHPVPQTNPRGGTLFGSRGRDANRAKRTFGSAIASTVLAIAVVAGTASATSFKGPLATTIESGFTICAYSTSLSNGSVEKYVKVNPTSIRSAPTSVKNVRWTIVVWSQATGSTSWNYSTYTRLGYEWFDGNNRRLLLTGRFADFPIPSIWTGEIRTSEKIELLDSSGRPLQGGTWGAFGEDQYATVFDVPGLSPPHQEFLGVCQF